MSCSNAAVLTRANYLSRLRRAFSLRVHPDLFRNDADHIRQKQSKLVKALANRLSDTDFVAWQSYEPGTTSPPSSTINQRTLAYVIRHRDGTTLLSHKLPLHSSVDRILQAMADALQQSGATVPTLPQDNPETMATKHRSAPKSASSSTSPMDNVDHRYDIVSNRGRSLRLFLQQLDPKDVADRKAARLDAQAVAAQVRRLYQFQAVDATALGWSSANVTVLLQRLLDLHAEHGHQLHVQSFSPLRLVFTSDNEQTSLAIDPYGGILHLSPAATPLQWLTQLQRVTPDVLATIRMRRARVTQMLKDLQQATPYFYVFGDCNGDGGGVSNNDARSTEHYPILKWKKGYSCSSVDFYSFLERLTASLPPSFRTTGALDETTTAITTTHALVVSSSQATTAATHGSLVVTIENPAACRRPTATRQGILRLGAHLTPRDVHAALQTTSAQAAVASWAETQAVRAACQSLAQQATWQLGLARLDIGNGHSSPALLDPYEIQASLTRLLQAANVYRSGLAGHTVGLVRAGMFCHLGDDGRVNLPQDWW